VENNLQFDAVKLAHEVVVNVEIRRMRELRLRLYIAKQLFRLGCWIANLTLEENEVVGVLITEPPEVPVAKS
jgi:hypothetical protein